jgi:hypothetical protein
MLLEYLEFNAMEGAEPTCSTTTYRGRHHEGVRGHDISWH